MAQRGERGRKARSALADTSGWRRDCEKNSLGYPAGLSETFRQNLFSKQICQIVMAGSLARSLAPVQNRQLHLITIPFRVRPDGRATDDDGDDRGRRRVEREGPF